MITTAAAALIAATALHAGFQITVTFVVYPALSRVDQERWAPAHAAHSRNITGVVAAVYAAATLACGRALLDDPDDWSIWIAAGATATAIGLTAAVAAPLHSRLSGRLAADWLRRLILVDRLRCVAAMVAAIAATVAAIRGPA